MGRNRGGGLTMRRFDTSRGGLGRMWFDVACGIIWQLGKEHSGD
jgi:hypothetical protein